MSAVLPRIPVPRIQYGNRVFTYPSPFPPVISPVGQGLYVIVTPDQTFQPQPYKLLYIGQSADLGQRLTSQHHKYGEWLRTARGGRLFYGWHSTLGLTERQRCDAEEELIRLYNPPCNEQLVVRRLV